MSNGALRLLSAWLVAAAPCLGAEIYFNSYGWHDIYRLDTTTGAVQHIPPTDIFDTGFCSSATFASDGSMYCGAGYDLYRVTFAGGLATWTHVAEMQDQFHSGLAFDAQNSLFAASGDRLRRASLSGVTLETVSLTYQGRDFYAEGIDFAADGTLWATDSSGLYRLHRTTGVATLVVESPNLDGGIFTSMGIGDDGVVRVLGSFGRLFEYNMASGASGWRNEELEYQGQSFAPSSMTIRSTSGGPASGDFDQDGDADGADLLQWQRGLGKSSPQLADGDADRNGVIDGRDLTAWRGHFGSPAALAVPEPSAGLIGGMAAICCALGSLAAGRRREIVANGGSQEA